MKIKSSKIFKIIAIALCFFMLFEQSGFAQVAGQLDISGHIAAFRNNLVLDKFRPLHLRYLQYDPQLNNFNLLLDKGNTKHLSKPFVEGSTQTLLNYFFIGVTLPNDSFWVNLRPDSPQDIIDPLVAQTDIGRIFLEADVQLKKDIAKFTSPETPEGKEYWDKLYEKAGAIFGSQNVTIPTLTRPWIVPNEIILRETSDNAYIYKATLKVMLEEDYLKGSAVYGFSDPRLKELNAYASSVLREKIIPKLTQEVNTSKRYAALRQVYYSLILAQWFKQRFQGQVNKGLSPKGTVPYSSSPYISLIDRRNLTGLTSKESWSKNTYFQQYQKSFKDGEYNFKVPITTPYGQVIRSYFSGGVAFGMMAQAITFIQGKISDLREGVPNFLTDVKSLIRLRRAADGAVEVNEAALALVEERQPIVQVKNPAVPPAAQGAENANVITADIMYQELVKMIVSLPAQYSDRQINLLIDALLHSDKKVKDIASYYIVSSRALSRTNDVDRFWDIVEARQISEKIEIYKMLAEELFHVDYSALAAGLNDEVGQIAVANFFPQIEDKINERLNEVKQELKHPFLGLLKWLADSKYRAAYAHKLKFYQILQGHIDGNPWRTIFKLQGYFYDVTDKLKLRNLDVMDGLSIQQLTHVNRSSFFRVELKESLKKNKEELMARINEKVEIARQNSNARQVVQLAVIGAAFGQEPISLAVELNRLLEEMGVDRSLIDFEIHVFDLPNPAYERVKDNSLIFPQDVILDVSFTLEERNTYFTQQGKGFARSEFLNNRIRFHNINLLDPDSFDEFHSLQGTFDFVMLHNVLQYLRPEMMPNQSSLDKSRQGKVFEETIKESADFVHSLANREGILSIITNGNADPFVTDTFNARPPAAAPQQGDSTQGISGGTMGRWNYSHTTLAADGTLTLHNATRIPRKDGVVEEEFLVDGENIQRDVVLQTRPLNSSEQQKFAKAKGKLGDVAVPLDKIRVITDASAAAYRIYGIAADGTIFIREAIFREGNPDQIAEALDHENRELTSQGHSDIRREQYQGNLRALITQFSEEDKKESGAGKASQSITAKVGKALSEAKSKWFHRKLLNVMRGSQTLEEKAEKKIEVILQKIFNEKPPRGEEDLFYYSLKNTLTSQILSMLRQYPGGFIRFLEAGGNLNSMISEENREYLDYRLEKIIEIFNRKGDFYQEKARELLTIKLENNQEVEYAILRINLESEYGKVGCDFVDFAKERGLFPLYVEKAEAITKQLGIKLDQMLDYFRGCSESDYSETEILYGRGLLNKAVSGLEDGYRQYPELTRWLFQRNQYKYSLFEQIKKYFSNDYNFTEGINKLFGELTIEQRVNLAKTVEGVSIMDSETAKILFNLILKVDKDKKVSLSDGTDFQNYNYKKMKSCILEHRNLLSQDDIAMVIEELLALHDGDSQKTKFYNELIVSSGQIAVSAILEKLSQTQAPEIKELLISLLFNIKDRDMLAKEKGRIISVFAAATGETTKRMEKTIDFLSILFSMGDRYAELVKYSSSNLIASTGLFAKFVELAQDEEVMNFAKELNDAGAVFNSQWHVSQAFSLDTLRKLFEKGDQLRQELIVDLKEIKKIYPSFTYLISPSMYTYDGSIIDPYETLMQQHAESIFVLLNNDKATKGFANWILRKIPQLKEGVVFGEETLDIDIILSRLKNDRRFRIPGYFEQYILLLETYIKQQAPSFGGAKYELQETQAKSWSYEETQDESIKDLLTDGKEGRSLSGHLAIHGTKNSRELLEGIITSGFIISREVFETLNDQNAFLQALKEGKVGALGASELTHFAIDHPVLGDSRYNFVYPLEMLLENQAFVSDPLSNTDWPIGGFSANVENDSHKIPVRSAIILIPKAEQEEMESLLARLEKELSGWQRPQRIFYYEGDSAREGLQQLKEEYGLETPAANVAISKQPKIIRKLSSERWKNLSLLAIKDVTDINGIIHYKDLPYLVRFEEVQDFSRKLEELTEELLADLIGNIDVQDTGSSKRGTYQEREANFPDDFDLMVHLNGASLNDEQLSAFADSFAKKLLNEAWFRAIYGENIKVKIDSPTSREGRTLIKVKIFPKDKDIHILSVDVNLFSDERGADGIRYQKKFWENMNKIMADFSEGDRQEGIQYILTVIRSLKGIFKNAGVYSYVEGGLRGVGTEQLVMQLSGIQDEHGTPKPVSSLAELKDKFTIFNALEKLEDAMFNGNSYAGLDGFKDNLPLWDPGSMSPVRTTARMNDLGLLKLIDVTHSRYLLKAEARVAQPSTIQPSATAQDASSQEYTRQIGKRAQAEVTKIGGKKYLKVTSTASSTAQAPELVELTQQDSQQLTDALISLITEESNPQYKQILEAFLEALQNSPPEFYTFSTLVADLFGLASDKDKLIALHEALTNTPAALLHEILEYLTESGVVRLELKGGDSLVISINATEFTIVLQAEALAIAQKGPNNPHYLLRALQREMLKDEDRALTRLVQRRQGLLYYAKKIGKSLLSKVVSSQELPTFGDYLKREKEVSASLLVAIQTYTNQEATLLTRFNTKIIKQLGRLVEFWDHNISNFIARQFADYQRGIVELVSNGLDASRGRGRTSVSINAQSKEIIVANSGSSITLKDIFTSFLIPTYTAKSVISEAIGRFGVGFLSALNYLDEDTDSLEIVSLNGDQSFRVRFGVRIEGEGKARKKVIIIKSIEENITLQQEEIAGLFPGIEAVTEGTSIRIVSQRLNQPQEAEKINSALNERFDYWTGEKLQVESYDADGNKSAHSVGLDIDNYTLAYSSDTQDTKGREFQLRFLHNPQDPAGFARAQNPGEGKLVITLQGVALSTIAIPGSNTGASIIINLPASTKIPTSRDKVIIDEKTIEGLLQAAQTICSNSELTANDKIAILNSLHYFLKWAKKTSSSKFYGITADLDTLVEKVIVQEEKRLENSPLTVIFSPDTLQATEFFAQTPGVIFVNPELLPQIRFAGKTPERIDQEIVPADLKDLKIFMVNTQSKKPLLRLGNTVFVGDNTGIVTTDIFWQYFLAATAVNYWEFMMKLLGTIEDSRFESAGRYSGVDEDLARKEMVLGYFDQQIEDMEAKLKEDSLDDKQRGGIEKQLASFKRLRDLIKDSPRGSAFFFIFKRHIDADPSRLKPYAVSAAEEILSKNISRKEVLSFIDNSHFYSNTPTGPAVEQTVHHKEAAPVSAVNLALKLAGALPPAGEARAVAMPEGLKPDEEQFIFAFEVISRWIEVDGRAAAFFESIEDEIVFKDLLQRITNYLAHSLSGNATEISEEKMQIFLSYLSEVYLRGKTDSKPQARVVSAEKNKRQILKGKLADISASLFRKGSDISVNDVSEGAPGLRQQAALGLILQSINYQDSEEFIFIRELLQNSIDAILESGGTPKINMFSHLVNDGEDVKLEFVLEDLVGMDIQRLLNFLLIPNRSSKLMAEHLTGFFGHGFFTVLKESEEVLVKTSDGKGRIITVRLLPVFDATEGVVTDVDYEIFEEKGSMQGTQISWRKRGPATPVDEVLVRAKAEMFGRIIDEDVEIYLNNRQVSRLDRKAAYLAQFLTANGRSVKVYLDQNQESQVIQGQLFVSRFDRRFFTDVLGIAADSHLFNLLVRLAELGVVVDLPVELSLTRDRAHFINENFDSNTKNAIIGALFDAAIRAFLAGKISLPHDFGYDFITKVSPDRLIDPAAQPGKLTFNSDLYDDPLNRIIIYLRHPNANLINITKNWIFGPEITLQDFLSSVSKDIEDKHREIQDRFRDLIIKLSELTDQAATGSLQDDDIAGFRLYFTEWMETLFGEQANTKNSSSMINGLIQNLKVGRLSAVSGLINAIIKEAYLAYIEHLIAEGVRGHFGLQRKVDGSSIFKEFILKQYPNIFQDFSAGEQASSPVIPNIEEEIISNLKNKFYAANSLDFRLQWATLETAAKEERHSADKGVAKRVEAELAMPKPLENGVSIDVVKRYKDKLPHLYLFLRANQIIFAAFKESRERREGKPVYRDNIDISAYYNPTDTQAAARGGSGRINLHLMYSFGHIQNIIRYLSNPKDKNFEGFLARVSELISHEMTHEEESKSGFRIKGDTHTKAFFDMQAGLLGAALSDPELYNTLKNKFQELVDEYSSLPNDVKEIVDKVGDGVKSEGELISEMNQVLSGNAPAAEVETLPPYTGAGDTSIHIVLDRARMLIKDGNLAQAKSLLSKLINDLKMAQETGNIPVLMDKWNKKGDFVDLLLEDIPAALKDAEALLAQAAQVSVIQPSVDGSQEAAQGKEIILKAWGEKDATDAINYIEDKVGEIQGAHVVKDPYVVALKVKLKGIDQEKTIIIKKTSKNNFRESKRQNKFRDLTPYNVPEIIHTMLSQDYGREIIIMEGIEGNSLAEMLSRADISIEELEEKFYQVGRLLGIWHKNNHIHGGYRLDHIFFKGNVPVVLDYEDSYTDTEVDKKRLPQLKNDDTGWFNAWPFPDKLLPEQVKQLRESFEKGYKDTHNEVDKNMAPAAAQKRADRGSLSPVTVNFRYPSSYDLELESRVDSNAPESVKNKTEVPTEKIKKAVLHEGFLKKTLENIHGIKNFSMQDITDVSVERIGAGMHNQVFLITTTYNGRHLSFVLKVAHLLGAGEAFGINVRRLRELKEIVPELVPQLGASSGDVGLEELRDLEIWSEEYINTGGKTLREWRSELSGRPDQQEELNAIEEEIARAYYLFYKPTGGCIEDPNPGNFIITKKGHKNYQATVIDIGRYHDVKVFTYDWLEPLMKSEEGLSAENIFTGIIKAGYGDDLLKLKDEFAGDKKLLLALDNVFVKEKEQPASPVRMATLPGRLRHSLSAIRKLAREFKSPVIFDIGIGWHGDQGPVTTKELAKELEGEAEIVGIDLQIPHYTIEMGDKDNLQVLLFDAQDNLLSIQRETRFETSESINEASRKYYIQLGKELRQKAKQSGSQRFSENGATIIFNPVSAHATKNLNFAQADLFHLAQSGITDKAHIVRIANVLIPHYTAAEIGAALASIAPFVHDDGYVLIGYSHQAGFEEEDYLVYRKKGGRFILTDYMFSVRGEGDIRFGVTLAAFRSPIKGMGREDLLGILKKWDKFEEWRAFVVAGSRSYLTADGVEKGTERYMQQARDYEEEAARFLAEGLQKEGVAASSLGSMVKVGIEEPSGGDSSLKNDLMHAIKESYLDVGVPQEAGVSKRDAGGIDLRALPIQTQPMDQMILKGRSPAGMVPLINASGIADKEWQQIENMVNAGIKPSLERIREYLILSCKDADCQAKIERALSGIADILRLEEENSYLTDAGLKEILVLLESNKTAEQLSVALAKIVIMPQEPMKI